MGQFSKKKHHCMALTVAWSDHRRIIGHCGYGIWLRYRIRPGITTGHKTDNILDHIVPILPCLIPK